LEAESRAGKSSEQNWLVFGWRCDWTWLGGGFAEF
jgi:hypothetical protein